MKYYILSFLMVIELMAANDLNHIFAEMGLLLEDSKRTSQTTTQKISFQPTRKFKFGSPLTKTECYVKEYLDEANVLDFDFPELIGVAYEFPRFRHQVRKMLKHELEFFNSESIILQVAYDIVSLRDAARKIIEKDFEESTGDHTFLQIASHIPGLRPKVFHIINEAIGNANYHPKILQIALDYSALRAKSMDIIANQLKEDDAQSELLQVAYQVPEFKQTVVSIVAKKLPCSDLLVLEIAANEKSLREIAALSVQKLLPSVEPKVIRLALLLNL